MAKPKPAGIRAAGVVLLRKRGDKTEVCVLHRPHRLDWSLPKGKVDRDEHVVATALRETVEETGHNVVLGIPLITQRYRVEGRPKCVRYWVGWATDGGPGFVPNREIDQLKWLTPNKAARTLTYPRDIQLMRAAVDADDTDPLIILRHVQARPRADWRGKPDHLRPLSSAGKRHAKRLMPVFQAYGIEQLHSSDAVRCADTLVPFANAAKKTISLEPLFSEDGFDPGRKAPFKRLNQLLADPQATVLCTHRPVLPFLVEHIARRCGLIQDKHLDPSLPPGGFLVLHRSFHQKRGMQIVAVERHAP